MKPQILIPPIIWEQQIPLVRQLLDVIDQQARFIEQKAAQIQQYKDEIARLKISSASNQLHFGKYNALKSQKIRRLYF